MKIVAFFIDLIYWLWLFLIPTCIMGAIAYYMYYNNPKKLVAPIVIFSIGVLLGIFIAELVRRKRGLAYFFSRIMASPDYDKFSKSDEEYDASHVKKDEEKASDLHE